MGFKNIWIIGIIAILMVSLALASEGTEDETSGRNALAYQQIPQPQISFHSLIIFIALIYYIYKGR